MAVFQRKGVLSEIVEDAALNFSLGNVARILQRLTGLALTLYLIIHIWVLGAASGGASAFNERMAIFESGWFAFLESFIVFLVAFHMFNGWRTVLIDFVQLSRWQKVLFQFALVGTLAVAAISGWLFFDRVFG